MNAIKKSSLLIALFAAAAAAQAAPVDVYGTADVGYSYNKLDGKAVHAVSSGGLSDSFFGIKASEDLGSGLKAVVTLEAGYDLDTGVTGDKLFNREASIGLTSGAHTLKLGRLQSLGYAAVKQFDAFGGGNLGMARGTSTVAEYNDNSVGYTFSQNDLQVGVQRAMGEQVDGGLSDGATSALSVAYARGPLSAAVVRTNVNAGPRTTLVAGGYDFGVAQASVQVQDVSNSVLDRSFLVGVKAPVKGIVALASIGQAKLVNGEKVDLYSVGATYNLSKRTSLYTAVGHVDATATNGDQFALGLNHTF
jgi:predicted porin